MRAIRIDNATRSLHTECPLYAAGFVIGTGGMSLQTVCADTPVTLEISTRLRALRACHHARTRNLGVNPSRQIALQTFEHLHALSLRFHLERQTGGMTRDIERGVRGIESLIWYSLFSIVPTLIEVVMVLTILGVKFDAWFAWITLAALALYIAFTVWVTEWRTKFRRQANEFDSAAHTKAVDSLLNYETVKYFNNEDFEARRYDESLQRWEAAAVRSQTSLSLLNITQSAIIAVAVTLIMWRATAGVVAGTMTIGDLVLVNAFMIQLYIPLNFLGVIYREIKQALADMERMFALAAEHLSLIHI